MTQLDVAQSELTLDYMVNPLLLGETTAHLIAWAFTHNEVPPLPPLIRQTANPHDIKVGFPAEFDNQDNWLEAIGEVRSRTSDWKAATTACAVASWSRHRSGSWTGRKTS